MIAQLAGQRCVRFDEPMRGHTSLAMGGPADLFFEPAETATLSAVMRYCREHGIALTPMGGGTNMVVRMQGIEGVVIRPAKLDELIVLHDDVRSVTIRTGAGVRLQSLLAYSRREGLSGLEGLAGVPGMIGGAAAGNAGAYGQEIATVLTGITLMDEYGALTTIRRDELRMGYRHCELPQRTMIVSVMLRLVREARSVVSARMDECLRKKRMSQPIGQRSAGCVFRNPQGDFAARLIDSAGLKGAREGDVMVSEVHAGFIVNTGNGTSDDFLRLMDRIRETVLSRFNIELQPEVKVVGRC